MRHLAFFRSASKELEGSSEYRTVLAGLVVMRLLDKWPSRDGDHERQVRDFTPVQQAVDALDDSPARRSLRGIVEAVGAYIEGVSDTRVARLIDYGYCLELDARWDPAADVFLTAIEVAPPNRAPLPRCYRHASVCFRKMGDLERSEQLIRDGQRIAVEVGDQVWFLCLRISEAKLAWHRGDLCLAESILDAVIADADAAGLANEAGLARVDRGCLASERKQDRLSAEYVYAGMKRLDEPRERMRAMQDLASALQNMGYLDQANALLWTVCQSPYADAETRTCASINLMYGSTIAGEQSQFDRLSRELRDQRFDGRLLAKYHEFLGRGYLRFDDPWRAKVEFAEAAMVARAHGIPRFQREAEEFLATSLEVILDEIRNRRGAFQEAANLG